VNAKLAAVGRASLLAATLLTTTRAGADPPKGHPPLAQALKGDAHVLYDAARELFKEGDYASAYAKFQRALELSHDPRLYWNLAACERKAKHNANVLRLIEAYLRDGEGWLSDDDKKEAARAVSAVRTFVASATVKTEPSDGVEITIDDLPVATTPVDKPIWIDVGVHRVRFTKPGGRTVERTEDIHSGAELHWTVDLEQTAPVEAPPHPSAPPERPAEPRGTSSRTGALVLGGAGIALAATGGAFVFSTTRRFSELRDECGTSCAPSSWESQRTLQVVGDILLGVGGAAIVAGAVWWITGSVGRSSPRAHAPLPGFAF
jgi:hypothetical protein